LRLAILHFGELKSPGKRIGRRDPAKPSADRAAELEFASLHLVPVVPATAAGSLNGQVRD
jgi:hypothetical protein